MDAFRIRGVSTPTPPVENEEVTTVNSAKSEEDIPEWKKRIANGNESLLALVQQSKPQKDADNENRLKKAGRRTAIVNALASLAGALPGLMGKNARGYAPNVQRTEQPFVDKLNKLEEDYAIAEKEYQQLETSARMQDLERALALQQQEENRAYAKTQRETAVEDARQQAVWEMELQNMQRAAQYGGFSGNMEDWMALPSAERQKYNTAATDKEHKQNIELKEAGRTTTSPKTTTSMDLADGQTLSVPTAVFNANYDAAYKAMIAENPELAAPPRFVKMNYNTRPPQPIYEDPSPNEKKTYLKMNIGKSPAAQQVFLTVIENQGTIGISGKPQEQPKYQREQPAPSPQQQTKGMTPYELLVNTVGTPIRQFNAPTSNQSADQQTKQKANSILTGF